MKIQEILMEKAKKNKEKIDDLDLDDVDEPEVDADQDKVPHLVMQLKKALDVNGDYPITFKDGKKIKIALKDIKEFLSKYNMLKPYDREEMQKLAGQDIKSFHAAIEAVVEPKPIAKIKGDRYMSSFAGDFDDK
jgi:hypothetical protein